MNWNKNLNLKYTTKSAFTVAELMILLLILSIMMAAFMPIITKRSVPASPSTPTPTPTEELWVWKGGTVGANIYVPDLQNTSAVMIGATSFPTTETAKLLLRSTTNTASTRYIVFAHNDTTVGRLVMTTSTYNNVGLGDVFNDTSMTGTGNTALGSGALYSNTTGVDNTAIGKDALYSNTTGSYNTAGGKDALKANVGGNGNTAYGVNALMANVSGNYNVAVGYNALSSLTSGNNNVGLGVESGYNMSSISDTVNIGYQSKTTGDGGIAIGYQAEAATGAIAIGYQAKATGSYSIAIGYTAIASGANSVAIGKDCSTSVDNQIKLGANNTYTVFIPGSLRVIGNATKTSGNLWTTSDIRLKDIKGFNNDGLDKISKLKVYKYTLKDDKEKTQNVGVMAQDLKKVFTNAVRKDDDGYLVIRQDDMFYAMVNAIKELDAKIQNAFCQVKALIARVQSIDNKINALIKKEQNNFKKIRELEAENKKLEIQYKLFDARFAKLKKLAKK